MFKTLTLTALATALLFGAMPAHADRIFNGAKLNGAVWNGVSLNGAYPNSLTLNSLTLNGKSANGATWNGFRLNGAEATGQVGDPATTIQVIGVELPVAR